MEKLTEKERKDIISLCKINNSKDNIKKVANDYGITTRYIYKLLKSEASREIDNSIIGNGSEFTKRANEIIKLLLDKIEEKALNSDDKTTLSQLSTTLGILYDKSRLESNLSTENKAISINIKIEK